MFNSLILKILLLALPIIIFGKSEINAKELPNRSISIKPENANAKEIAERFLKLSGGRDAWKSVRSIYLIGFNRSKAQRLPYMFEFWIDFAVPRTKTRILNHDMDRLRGYLGDSGWSIKESDNGFTSSKFSEERLKFEKILWEGAYSRNLWRLAQNDSSLVLHLGENERLEFHNKNGGLTAWFIFNSEGYPTRFGFPDDDKGIKLESFENYGLFKIPRLGNTPEGVVFETILFRVFDEPLNVPVTPPKETRSY